MSRQRQTEELVSKRKTTLELKKIPFFSPHYYKSQTVFPLLLICGQKLSFAKCGNFGLILAINEKESW